MNMSDFKIKCLQIFLFAFSIYFFSWLFAYKSGLNDLPIQSEDTVPAMFLPVTLLKERTFYADTYYKMMLDRYPHPDDKGQTQGLVPFYLRQVPNITDPKLLPLIEFDQHYITAFTLTPGILATPIYAPAVLAGISITWENLILLSHLASATIMALTGVLMYVLLRNHLLPQKDLSQKALILTLVYLFATVNFAMLSQALWQHGSLQLFTVVSLIFLLNGLKTQKTAHYVLFGFFMSLAVITRPTAALFAVLIFALIPLQLQKTCIKPTLATLLGVLPVAVFYLWTGFVLYGGFSNTGYASQMGSSWVSNIFEGFGGIWISPSKGILIYSPVLIFSLVGAYQAYKNKTMQNRHLFLISILIIFLHTLIMGKWKHWYGGFSFGYRLASDVLPFFIILLVPYILSYFYSKTKKAFYILFSFSVAVQLFGMIFFDSIWHNAYDNGYKDTRWLWSLRDSELSFNARRVLVKFGFLERACPKCLPEVQ